jgi:ABC-type multidrug transport system fused ATPase/permease subunit
MHLQDQAFFDKGQTGDVISRLSADVQSVSDSVCLNSNVLSRSALQVIFMTLFLIWSKAASQ